MISFLDNIVTYSEDDAEACAQFLNEVAAALALKDVRESFNALSAMCHHRDTHDASITPVAVRTAKPAPAGIGAVAGFGHRLGLPR